jgi:uncharacterized Zn finger protein
MIDSLVLHASDAQASEPSFGILLLIVLAAIAAYLYFGNASVTNQCDQCGSFNPADISHCTDCGSELSDDIQYLTPHERRAIVTADSVESRKREEVTLDRGGER